MGSSLNSPVIVVPISAFAFGLAIAPIYLWGQENSAQFYGAFFAAVVAAAAAFSGYFIQHKLTLERDQKVAKEKHLEELAALFFWLRYILVRIKRAQRIFERRLDQEDEPPDDTTVHFQLLSVARRTLLMTDIISETRSHAVIALKLPPKMRIVTAGRMHDLCEFVEGLKPILGEPDKKFSRQNLQKMHALFKKQEEYFQSVAKKVETHLDQLTNA